MSNPAMPSPTHAIKRLVILSSVLLLGACGGDGNEANENADNSTQYKTISNNTTTSSSSGTSPSTATIASGKALYNNNCFSCHGANMPNARDSARTLNAIAANKGGMGFLASSIKAPQANDIAAYLSYGL